MKLNMQRILLTLILLPSFAAQAQICETETTLQTTPTANFTTENPDVTRYPVSLATDGTEILDLSTGLVWQRCSVGQTWDNTLKQCKGVPEKLHWNSALAEAKTLRTNTQKNWRVPNIKELMSIVDFQCYAPPFNLEVFPNTPASISLTSNVDPNGQAFVDLEISGYWSSTPMISYGRELRNRETLTNSRTFSSMSAWYIDAESGIMLERAVKDYSSSALREQRNFVRFVR